MLAECQKIKHSKRKASSDLIFTLYSPNDCEDRLHRLQLFPSRPAIAYCYGLSTSENITLGNWARSGSFAEPSPGSLEDVLPETGVSSPTDPAAQSMQTSPEMLSVIPVEAWYSSSLVVSLNLQGINMLWSWEKFRRWKLTFTAFAKTRELFKAAAAYFRSNRFFQSAVTRIEVQYRYEILQYYKLKRFLR